MQHAFNYTKEEIMAMGEGWIDSAMRNSSDEKRLEGISVAKRLEGISVAKWLEGISPLVLLKELLPGTDDETLAKLLEQNNGKTKASASE